MRSIELSDRTLKQADSEKGISLSFKEKIDLAKLLDRLNVSAVELAPIKNRKVDSLLVKSIATAVKHAAVAVPVSQELESIPVTWAALKEARRPRLQLVAPTSPVQMEYFWHQKPANMLASIRERIARCREFCPEVELIAEDACRSEPEFLYQALNIAIEAGATAITLCDTAGLMFPQEFRAFLETVKKNVPGLENIHLGVQCSDHLSMGSACAMAAIQAGASEIKTAACGAEQTRIQDIAAILRGRGDDLNLVCDLRQSEIKRITGQIEWMCGGAGGRLLTPMERVSPAAAGDALTAHDDRAAVERMVEKIGYTLSEDDQMKVYEAFCQIAAKKESVSARELDSIVASVAMQVPSTYKLVHYVITCGNTVSASAHMRLMKNQENLEGISLGDGPIDAAFKAIEQILGHHYELDDFQIQAVTEGREAMGETVVRLRSDGKVFAGRGISTDIVGASIQAYLSALNKIVFEEAEA